MKKISGMILVLTLLLSACAKDEPIPITTAEQSVTQASSADIGTIDVLELSRQFAEGMAGGDFSVIVGYFTDELKKSLNEASLKTTWESTVLMLGNYIGIHDATQEIANEYVIVSVLLEYENNGLLVLLTYDKDNRVAGIRLNYQEIAKEDETKKSYEEIPVQVGTYQLDGILTLPKNVDKPPVVIMVQGSGPNDMDETLGAVSNKPFRDIAHGLADQGIATLRYNKRYNQRPDVYTATDTIEDEVLEDVYEAITLAMAREDVDTGSLYLLGHSLGGMLAPQIAAKRSDVKGLIIMAGSLRHLSEISMDQNLDAAKAMNMSQEEIDEGRKQFELMINNIKSIQNPSGISYLGMTDYYWKSLNDIDSKKLVSELDIPMLILQGSDDFQVYADVDYPLWEETLSGKADVSFGLFEGLNHLFMKSNGKKDLTEYDIKASVDQDVILMIVQWVNTH